MITSSPVDIEEVSPAETHIVYGHNQVSVFQKRRPYENAPTQRSKDELISYLRDLQGVINTDDHLFSLLPTPYSKNEFDHLLVDVHNSVVTKLNQIPTAERKRRYIDTYINNINHESFLARGERNKKTKTNKKMMIKKMNKKMNKKTKKTKKTKTNHRK